MLSESETERFWSRRQIVGDCWLWTRTKKFREYPAGGVVPYYGSFWSEGRSYIVHRLAYELTYGPIPKGLEVCHRCDTPACFNPDHLFLGTHTDNMRDKVKKGRVRSWRNRWFK